MCNLSHLTTVITLISSCILQVLVGFFVIISRVGNIGVPDGGAGGAAAPPGRNSNSLGGKALIIEEEQERGILMSLPHQRVKHIKQMDFKATYFIRKDV